MSDKVIKNTYLFALSLVNLHFGAIVIFNFVVLNSVQQNHLGRFKKLPVSRLTHDTVASESLAYAWALVYLNVSLVIVLCAVEIENCFSLKCCFSAHDF